MNIKKVNFIASIGGQKKQNLTGAKHQHRKKHFKKAHDMIEAHNKAKKHRYRLGHNHFSHMV